MRFYKTLALLQRYSLTVFLNRFLRPLPLGTILCGPVAFELQYFVIRVLLLGFNEPLLSSSSALEDTLASTFRSSSRQALHRLPASVECHRGVSRVPHLTHSGLLPSGIKSLGETTVSLPDDLDYHIMFTVSHVRSEYQCRQEAHALHEGNWATLPSRAAFIKFVPRGLWAFKRPRPQCSFSVFLK